MYYILPSLVLLAFLHTFMLTQERKIAIDFFKLGLPKKTKGFFVGTPRSENFIRNTPIIAKIPPKDPITKNPVTSREFGHPCVEVFARVSFEGFKSDASGEWG